MSPEIAAIWIGIVVAVAGMIVAIGTIPNFRDHFRRFLFSAVSLVAVAIVLAAVGTRGDGGARPPAIEPPPATAGAVGEIQSPDEGSVFGTGEEFRVSGSVRNLPQGYSVWLLAVSADAPNQDFYFVNPDPVASNDGEWADTDSYAVAGRREIVLVQAEPACDNRLRAAAQTPSDARADTLGEGCRILSRRTLTIQ